MECWNVPVDEGEDGVEGAGGVQVAALHEVAEAAVVVHADVAAHNGGRQQVLHLKQVQRRHRLPWKHMLHCHCLKHMTHEAQQKQPWDGGRQQVPRLGQVQRRHRLCKMVVASEFTAEGWERGQDPSTAMFVELHPDAGKASAPGALEEEEK